MILKIAITAPCHRGESDFRLGKLCPIGQVYRGQNGSYSVRREDVLIATESWMSISPCLIKCLH